MANRQQIIIIQTLFSKLGITDENKEEVVRNFSRGTNSSVSKMDFKHAGALIAWLKEEQIKADAANDKKRKRIISNCYQMGMQGMPAIYNYIKDKFKKDLNKMTGTELSAAIGTIENKLLPHYLQNKTHA